MNNPAGPFPKPGEFLDITEHTPEQEKALKYLEKRRASARKKVARFESAMDYNAGDGGPGVPEDIKGLMHLDPDELADQYEEAVSYLGGLSRTVTEVQGGNTFLADHFSRLQSAIDARASNKPDLEESQ